MVATPAIIAIGDCMLLMNPAQAGALRGISTFTKEWAGAEANFLIGCQRLGVPTGFLSAFSRADPFGAFIHAQLASEGIDLSQCQWDTTRATPLFFKQRERNGDTTAYYYRTNTAGTFLSADSIDKNYFNRAKIFYFTSIFPTLSTANAQLLRQLLPQLKARGVSIAFDPNIRLKLFCEDDAEAAARELITPYLQWVDILLTNNNEAEILFGTQDTAQVFAAARQHDIHHVALKRGAQGAVATDGKTIVEHPTVATKVVDCRGAGDAFNAGFLYAWHESQPLVACIATASHTAAFAVASPSDNAHAPTLTTLQKSLQNHNPIPDEAQ